MEKPTIKSQDKSEKITFRCPAELKRAVSIAAINRGVSIESLCVQLVASGLKLKVA